jgi:hypothetical protein
MNVMKYRLQKQLFKPWCSALVLALGLLHLGACTPPQGRNLVISEKALNATRPAVSPSQRIMVLDALFLYVLANQQSDTALHESVALAPTLPQSGLWQIQADNGKNPVSFPVGAANENKPVAQWYAKRFKTGFAYEGRQIRLDITALAKPARLWLNGHLLGHFSGDMERKTVDVTRHIIPGGENTLVMRTALDEDETYTINRDILASRLMVPQQPLAHFAIRASGNVSIEKIDLHSPLYPDTQVPDLTANITLFNASKQPRYLIVKTQVLPVNFSEKPAITQYGRLHKPGLFKIFAKPGLNVVTVKPETRPMRLWWPGTYGSPFEYSPHLYRLDVGLYSDTEQLDMASTPLGLRTIENTTITEKDGTEKKALAINGTPVFIKGVTYHSDAATHPRTRKTYLQDLSLALKTNANAVLVTGTTEAPAFYDLCDELGLAVFQTLPSGFDFDQTAKDMQWLTAHPSVSGWFIRKSPRKQLVMSQDDSAAFAPEPSLADKQDTQASLPANYAGRPVFGHNKTFAAKGVDSGSWFDYGLPETRRFVDAFGAPSAPSLAVMQDMFGPNVGLPSTKAGWGMFEKYGMDRHSSFAVAKIKTGRTLPAFIHNSQLYQARLVQLAGESMRIQRFSPVSAALPARWLTAAHFLAGALWIATTHPNPPLQLCKKPISLFCPLSCAINPTMLSATQSSWVYMP